MESVDVCGTPATGQVHSPLPLKSRGLGETDTHSKTGKRLYTSSWLVASWLVWVLGLPTSQSRTCDIAKGWRWQQDFLEKEVRLRAGSPVCCFSSSLAGTLLSLSWPVPQDLLGKLAGGDGPLLNTVYPFLHPLLSAPRKRTWCFFDQPRGPSENCKPAKVSSI